jgi:hypothetical protein
VLPIASAISDPKPKTVEEQRIFHITPDGIYWVVRETKSPESERFVTKISAQIAASTRAKQCSPSLVKLFSMMGNVETEWGY